MSVNDLVGVMDITKQPVRGDDVRFLKEYADFSCRGSFAIAEILYNAISSARQMGDYAIVAHSLAKLHHEMILQFEATGALLYSFSKWDEPNGIIGSMLDYRPCMILPFLEKLTSAEDPFEVLRFPTQDLLMTIAGDSEENQQAYSAESLHKLIGPFCRMYMDKDIRISYNKLKHGSMIVRAPYCVLPTEGPKSVQLDCIRILIERPVESEPVFVPISVTGAKGKQAAERYLNNIMVMTEKTVGLARLVAKFLEYGIMRPKGDGA